MYIHIFIFFKMDVTPQSISKSFVINQQSSKKHALLFGYWCAETDPPPTCWSAQWLQRQDICCDVKLDSCECDLLSRLQSIWQVINWIWYDIACLPPRKGFGLYPFRTFSTKVQSWASSFLAVTFFSVFFLRLSKIRAPKMVRTRIPQPWWSKNEQLSLRDKSWDSRPCVASTVAAYQISTFWLGRRSKSQGLSGRQAPAFCEMWLIVHENWPSKAM